MTAIASEHDGSAGTERGPEHDLPLRARPACGSAISATSGRAGCATSRRRRSARSTSCSSRWAAARRSAARRPRHRRSLAPRWVVPMHYRTPRISFLETADEFLEGCRAWSACRSPVRDRGAAAGRGPLVVVPPPLPGRLRRAARPGRAARHHSVTRPYSPSGTARGVRRICCSGSAVRVVVRVLFSSLTGSRFHSGFPTALRGPGRTSGS